MNPAVSVVLLTVLCGLGQGTFVRVLVGHVLGATPHFLIVGTVSSLVLCGAGLIASFFHLGRPERAWRAVAQWRTSWLSREVIALPAFMGLVFLYGVLGLAGGTGATLIGVLALFSCVALWVCTAMIYACLRFIQEWASRYTIANFVLLSLASGATVALVLAAIADWSMIGVLATLSVVLTIAAGMVRLMSLRRNASLVPRSTVQSAIGIHQANIRQRSMGATGGTFNTREFFHGRTLRFLRSVKTTFLVLAFVLPVLLIVIALASGASGLMLLALPSQVVGLLLERWFFFAQANHPQNLYYQAVS